MREINKKSGTRGLKSLGITYGKFGIGIRIPKGLTSLSLSLPLFSNFVSVCEDIAKNCCPGLKSFVLIYSHEHNFVEGVKLLLIAAAPTLKTSRRGE